MAVISLVFNFRHCKGSIILSNLKVLFFHLSKRFTAEDMEVSKKQRLIEAVNFLISEGILRNKSHFGELVGIVSSGNLSQVLSDKYDRILTESQESNFLSRFPIISPVWYYTGEGPMLKPTAVQQVEGNGGVLTQVTGDLPPIRKIVGNEVEVVPMDNYVAVPFYDLEASAGLPNGDTPAGWVETRLVPRQYAGDEYLVVRVSGDSMDDGTSRSLCHGDEIVVKRELFDPANTLPIRSKLFVVDTMEGAVIKQILECNRSEGTVTLHSFNERYRDYQVPLSEVRGFYSVQCFSMKSIRF